VQTYATLEDHLRAIRNCTECKADLPLEPRPVLRASIKSRILVAGQAPGTRVHETGIPWNDPSGIRLREWLGVEDDAFYDPDNFAIIPQGFCYPGKNPKGGDNPPRPECALKWHDTLIPRLPNIELVLAVGQYAQNYHLKNDRKKNLTETVRTWDDYMPAIFPLPHPSWRVNGWIKRNPWFEETVLPALKSQIKRILNTNI
jgi:uracil-DNA glycosylase